MRVENWAPVEVITSELEKQAMNKLEKVCEVVAKKARGLVPIGKDRPTYTAGNYAGKEWTSRKAGTLRDSIRVVRLKGDPGKDVRVYAGARQSNKLTAYYAHMVEYGSINNDNPRKPFLRPAFEMVAGNLQGYLDSIG